MGQEIPGIQTCLICYFVSAGVLRLKSFDLHFDDGFEASADHARRIEGNLFLFHGAGDTWVCHDFGVDHIAVLCDL